MNEEVKKKGESLFIVANLIVAIFSFGFLLGGAEIVSAQSPQLENSLEQNDQVGGNLEQPTLDQVYYGQPSASYGIGTSADITLDSKLTLPTPSQSPGRGPTETPPEAAAGPIGYLKGKLIDPPAGAGSGLLQGVAWAGVAFFATKWLGGALGLEEPTTEALQYGLSVGLFTAGTLRGLAAEGGIFAKEGTLGFIGSNPFLVGAGVGIVVFALTYKKVEYRRVDFTCNAWEAPIGGDKCEECNDGVHPCSEYRCKALGQACGIVNEGTAEERCVWLNPRDVSSPIIKPWEDALDVDAANDVSCSYTNLENRPSSAGTQIQCQSIRNNCIPAFTPFEFGIQTNKPAQCKIDFSLTETYDEMQWFFGDSNIYAYNHTQRLNIPSKRAIEALAESQNDSLAEDNILIENNNQYDLYVRCTSANGFYNPDPYVVQFCVDDSPDVTPPRIVETSIRNGQPVQFEVDEVPIIVYTNEPASCRWSRTDQNYNDMENTMTCADGIEDVEDNLLYSCKGDLTNVEDRKDNLYYFRCEDQPWLPVDERIKMTQSFEFILKGTESLNIKEDSVKPNETVTGATTTVPVFLELETENGFNEGEAECFFSLDNNDFVPFFETNSHVHKQRQDLTAGDYTYYLKCLDLGGNQASTSTNFSVFVDTFAPQVVRLLNDGGNLKIITDEDAECYYSTNTNTECNYNIEEGQFMPHENANDQNEHFAPWNVEDTYYVKCEDENGKQPAPNECSITVKPVNLAEPEDDE